MNLSSLKNKNISLLLLGKLTSNLGTRIQSFALSLYIFNTTGSAILFASILAITDIPSIIIQPIAGVIADRFDRKKIIVCLDILCGIITGSFAIIYELNNNLPLIYIFFLVISLSIIAAIFDPASNAIIPSIVSKDELVTVNSLRVTISNIVLLIAPMISGVLYTTGGLSIILIINSISFILSAISEMFISIPKLATSTSNYTKGIYKALFDDFLDGIKYIKSNKVLISIYILVVIYNLGYSPLLSIGIPYIVLKKLGISNLYYSTLSSITIIAMLIGPFLTGILNNRFTVKNVVISINFITPILMFGIIIITSPLYLSMSSSFWLPYISIAVILFIIMIIESIAGIFLNTLEMQEVPQNLFGRIDSVGIALSMSTMPLGKLAFGIMIDKIPLHISLGICVMIMFLAAFIFRFLVSKNKLEDNHIIAEDTN